jgi:hypothetical protein
MKLVRRALQVSVGVAFLTVVVMWVRTHRVTDWWSYTGVKGSVISDWRVTTGPGAVEITHSTGTAKRDVPADVGFAHGTISPAAVLIFQSIRWSGLGRVGLRYASEPDDFAAGVMVTGGHWSVVNFPMWLLAVVLWILLIIPWTPAIFRRVRRTRSVAGPIAEPPAAELHLAP